MTQFSPAPLRFAPLLAMASLLAALSLGGCARDRDTTPYPSLAVRPVEKQGFAEPAAKPVVLRPDPALDTQITQLGGRLDEAGAAFATAYDRARDNVTKAKGQAVGSDAWLAAQTELATLDEIRSRSSAILTEIDDLAIKRAAALEPDYPALVAMRERATAQTTKQGEQIKALTVQLPSG